MVGPPGGAVDETQFPAREAEAWASWSSAVLTLERWRWPRILSALIAHFGAVLGGEVIHLSFRRNCERVAMKP